MAKKLIKQEIEEWLESDDVETAMIELSKINDEKADFIVGEEEHKFVLNYPKDYPKSTEKFFVFSEEEALSEWQQQLNEYVEKPNLKIADILTKAADLYLSLVAKDDEEESNELEEEEDIGIDTSVPKPKPKKSKEEEEIDNKEFLSIGSPAATMRLIKDLKSISKGNPKELGFSAGPVTDKKTGLENLYHWNVKLFGFDKGSDLYKDMISFSKKTGQDHVLIELRFSKDYPFAPPFVRVVKPRFAFRTGHVTIGGSICMELLTNSGWNSTNDIESILIQIRAEMLSGNARLDPGSGNYEYSEHEAWDAFYRAARTHGWNVDNLNKDMFPKHN